jgi:uncharacterized protein YecE (DUF72 family)
MPRSAPLYRGRARVVAGKSKNGLFGDGAGMARLDSGSNRAEFWTAMQIYAGTSGYSYPKWRGPFYPEKLPAADMLAYYADHLPAVEINNTFYRLPSAKLIESWARQVPEQFRFVVKASQRITHQKRLKDAGDETAYLLQTTSSLQARLGAILFQLPPFLRLDVARLQIFLDLLPEGTRGAFEFRHPSWQDPTVLDLLRARDMALVVVDDEGQAPDEIVSTAAWGYLRLRRPGYGPAEIKAWAERVGAQAWEEAFVFFKHEDAGAGPRLASDFLQLSGTTPKRQPVKEAPATRPTPRRRQAG